MYGYLDTVITACAERTSAATSADHRRRESARAISLEGAAVLLRACICTDYCPCILRLSVSFVARLHVHCFNVELGIVFVY